MQTFKIPPPSIPSRQGRGDLKKRQKDEELVITVEMGEGAVSEAPDIITTAGCGSCVVIVLYDARRKVGGLAHVMLPTLFNHNSPPCGTPSLLKRGLGGVKEIFQFASTAIPALLDEMQKRGCLRRNITAKIAGGAKMFSSYAEFPAGIGEQNLKSIRQSLEMEGIVLTGFDVGRKHGRSVEFHLDSGRVFVKAFEREDREI